MLQEKRKRETTVSVTREPNLGTIFRIFLALLPSILHPNYSHAQHLQDRISIATKETEAEKNPKIQLEKLKKLLGDPLLPPQAKITIFRKVFSYLHPHLLSVLNRSYIKWDPDLKHIFVYDHPDAYFDLGKKIYDIMMVERLLPGLDYQKKAWYSMMICDFLYSLGGTEKNVTVAKIKEVLEKILSIREKISPIPIFGPEVLVVASDQVWDKGIKQGQIKYFTPATKRAIELYTNEVKVMRYNSEKSPEKQKLEIRDALVNAQGGFTLHIENETYYAKTSTGGTMPVILLSTVEKIRQVEKNKPNEISRYTLSPQELINFFEIRYGNREKVAQDMNPLNPVRLSFSECDERFVIIFLNLWEKKFPHIPPPYTLPEAAEGTIATTTEKSPYNSDYVEKYLLDRRNGYPVPDMGHFLEMISKSGTEIYSKPGLTVPMSGTDASGRTIYKSIRVGELLNNSNSGTSFG